MGPESMLGDWLDTARKSPLLGLLSMAPVKRVFQANLQAPAEEDMFYFYFN